MILEMKAGTYAAHRWGPLLLPDKWLAMMGMGETSRGSRVISLNPFLSVLVLLGLHRGCGGTLKSRGSPGRAADEQKDFEREKII